MWKDIDEHPEPYKDVIIYVFSGRTMAGTPIYTCVMGYWNARHERFSNRNVIKWCYPPEF